MPPPVAKPPSASPAEPLIGGRYAVDLMRPLPGAGGGLAAFAAIDRGEGRGAAMAVQVRPGAPPRAAELAQMLDFADPGVLAPLAHGPAIGPDRRPAWFVVCRAPAGPALWPQGAAATRPWSEGDLVERLLQPAAAALVALAGKRVTHRAIRPDNLFLDPARGNAVMLGCAWASPPALLQPAICEAPSMAMCPGVARGEGSVAEDVYALGVTLLIMAMGRMPLAGLDDTAVIRRKLELGCFQALAGEARLPGLIADLVRGMLSQEPQHRPSPELLMDPAAARGRQVATRPPRRASRPVEIGAQAAWDARSLALAIAREPEPAAKMLRQGMIDHWLRRVLIDTALAERIEELQARRRSDGPGEDPVADARLTMRAVALLDPLAPLCWRGLAVWPDGFGPLLAAAASELPAEEAGPVAAWAGAAEQAITLEIVSDWAGTRADPEAAGALRQSARQIRAVLRRRGWAGGLPRLVYTLSPLQPCRSPLLGGALVARLADLCPALEAAAGRPELRAQMPIDREIAAFIAARQDQREEAAVLALEQDGPPGAAAVPQIALLARLQQSHRSGPLPALAAWLAALGGPLLEGWRSTTRRKERQAALAAAIPAGDLAALRAVLDDAEELARDERGFREAQAAIARIDARLARLTGNGSGRAEASRRLGQEIAAALGLAALAGTAVAAALR